MTDDYARNDGLADVINLLAAPIASGLRTVDQFRRGADELIRSVENLNRTMENLNETAMRLNRLIADVEEPVRAMMPQLTRTIETADQMTRLLEGPVRSTAPNIEKMVDTLSSPGFASLPKQMGDFMHTISEVTKGLGPLTQLAENAGGLFGGFKLPGMGPASAPPEPRRTPAAEADEPSVTLITRTTTGSKQTASKKAAAKKSPAKKTTAKKTTPKKKAASKKSGSKKS